MMNFSVTPVTISQRRLQLTLDQALVADGVK